MEVNENLALSAANYENHVGLKFQLYNSLFLTLPLDGIKNTGIFIPVLNEFCLAKLAEGHSPVQIIAQFFEEYKDGENRAEQIDFLFKVGAVQKSECPTVHHGVLRQRAPNQ